MAKDVVLVPLLLFLLPLSTWAVAGYGSQCQRKCGSVAVPYPFGISNMGSTPANGICFRGSPFNLTCNISYEPPKLFWGKIEVSNISLETAELTIVAPMNYECDSSTVSMAKNNSDGYIKLKNDWSFAFSQRNILISTGCDTTTTLRGYWGRNAVSSCSTFCSNDSTGLVADGYCDGFGWCQLPISKGVKSYNITVRRYSDEHWLNYDSKCGFGFITDRDKFVFNKSYLRNYSFYSERNKSSPVVLDWAIHNITCDVAPRSPDYACKKNAFCINSTLQPGYLCACKKGFKGNPYRQCEDVDECSNKAENNCTHFCHNKPGSYRCSCPRGMVGDGRSNGSGCKLPLVQLIFGGILIIIILVLVGTLIYCYLQKERFKKLKAEYYYKNGGSIYNKLTSRGAVDVLKVFYEKEIKKATNNYSEVIGEGGYGVVYRGYFPECGEVAVKKSKKMDENQVEEFINELAVLYRMNHKNVVKLLGCCLDAKSPILVYEFINNGSLADRLHHKDLAGSIPFEKRLTIALETATVFGFLHSDVSVPIIHGDVKSANILLDSNLVVKVSDFGTSKLVPSDQQAQIETIVKGTPGYLDPQYLQTCQLTEKSDVYSFGVVLVELLTGRRPISGLGSRPAKPIVAHFINAMRQNRLWEVCEPRVWNEGEERVILSVGRLAEMCLRVTGEDRPTMKEVAEHLQQLVKKRSDHSWRLELKQEEKVNLVNQAWDNSLSFPVCENKTTEISVIHDIEMIGGR